MSSSYVTHVNSDQSRSRKSDALFVSPNIPEPEIFELVSSLGTTHSIGFRIQIVVKTPLTEAAVGRIQRD